jgi:hypothetical protein
MSIWIFIIAVVVAFYLIERRFKKIETYINVPEHTGKNSSALQPVSYQAGISVDPDWVEIIKWCFPKLKTDEEAWSFVKNLYKDPELKLDKAAGLFQKRFDFVEIYDAVSGINPIWSNHYKGFLNDLEIWGKVFDEGDGHKKDMWEMFPDNRIKRLMVISPNYIGFRSNLPDGDMGDEDKISQFPYYSVINFFTEVHQNSGTIWGGELMVKKFPKRIQEMFDKYKIEYDTWDFEDYGTGVDAKKEIVTSKWLESKGIELYDQKMRSHNFKSPYFNISIKLKFFRPDDR